MTFEQNLKRYDLVLRISKDLCNTVGTENDKITCEELRDKTVIGDIDIEDYLKKITPIIEKDNDAKQILNELKRITIRGESDED